MTAPRFTILTQQEITIDLSRPAMSYLLSCMDIARRMPFTPLGGDDVVCELDNFKNMLHNLLERSEPEPENFDLIGE